MITRSLPYSAPYAVVWGDCEGMTEMGLVGVYTNLRKAHGVARRWAARTENPAIGAWVVVMEDQPMRSLTA